MVVVSVLAALALAGADAAPAADKPAAAAMKTKKVCTSTNVTGGRLAHKRCVTVKVPAEESASAPATATAEAAKPEAQHQHDH